MPELPEVETIKEDLRELVVGSTVEEAEVLDPALVEEPNVDEFVERLRGGCADRVCCAGAADQMRQAVAEARQALATNGLIIRGIVYPSTQAFNS